MFYTNIFQRNQKIFIRGYDDNLQPFAQIVDDYKPYLFFPGKGNYKTIFGQPVEKKIFPSLKSAYELLRQYRDVENAEFYGLTQFIYTYLNDRFPGRIEFNEAAIAVVSLDIEVDSKDGFPSIEEAKDEITAITLVKNSKSITFGTKAYKPQHSGQQYVYSENETEMLKAFLKTWNTVDWRPDVITGWSADLFDIPYLIHRIQNLIGPNAVRKLSPFGFVQERDIIRSKQSSFKSFNDRKDKVYEIYGITILDYLQLYKKFTFTNHESYSLNNIAKVELSEEKVDYGDYGNLDNLYEKNPQLFYEYNIHDALLVDRLEDKLKFIRHCITTAYEAKVNYIDSMVTLKPWDVIIHNYLLERGIVIPQKKDKPVRKILGGYVKDSHKGMSQWVVSFDFDSLYPSIISQHNISPETFVEKIHSSSPEHIIRNNTFPSYGDDIVCANGTVYRRDIRGFIPDIIDYFKDKRAKIKSEMLRLEKEDEKLNEKEIGRLERSQNAIKILNNGLYGALTMEYFRWYDADLGEAVTYTAQVCTRYVEREINLYLNKLLKTELVDYVIHADTDSIYLNMEPLVIAMGMQNEPTEKIIEFLDQVCKTKIQPIIQGYCNFLCEKFKVYTPKLNMKREVITNKVIFRASKMYILNVWDKEGKRYTEPQLKTKGIETVRSSTPMVVRSKLKECIKLILNKDEKSLQDYIEAFHEEYKKLPFEDVAFPRTVDGLLEYGDAQTLCKKGTPIHTRGALVYNKAIEEMDLTNKYKLIKDKEKIRFAYLKDNNPFNSHVIAAPDALPPEFGLDKFIDRETQWEKTFLKPIQSITELINWKTESIATLEDFF